MSLALIQECSCWKVAGDSVRGCLRTLMLMPRTRQKSQKWEKRQVSRVGGKKNHL